VCVCVWGSVAKYIHSLPILMDEYDLYYQYIHSLPILMDEYDLYYQYIPSLPILMDEYDLYYIGDILHRHKAGVPNGVEVVLEGREKEILTEFHGSAFGGHSGINKTTQSIQISYWWSGLTDDVKNYVS